MRRAGADKKGVRFVFPGFEIFAQADLSLSVEIYKTLFVAFPVSDEDGTISPVNIRKADVSAFRNAAAGREKEIDQRFFADVFGVPP